MNEVEEFIKRRFAVDCNWLCGNCYYLALILKDRFNGTIYYDPVEGHFICEVENDFYDYTGKINKPKILYDWCWLYLEDINEYNRIVRDCCM